MTELLPSPIVYSRPVAAAVRLGTSAPDRHRFLDKRVVLTGDPGVLATRNGRTMALTALRLLPRLTPHVVVWMPGAPNALIAELRGEANRVAFGGPIEVREGDAVLPADSIGPDAAVLSIGPAPVAFATETAGDSARGVVRIAEARCTSIASNGWCMWVARGTQVPYSGPERTNPVGAVAAASLGVAEIFKIFLVLKAERGAPADGTPFSLFTYTAGNADPGPDLPERLEIDALLVGFGAIGNGIVATLAELPLVGQLIVVDRQKFGPENLGTCALLAPTDVGREKSYVAADALMHLHPALVVKPVSGEAEQELGRIHPVPTAVLNGLDNRDARREAQRLWADVTIDGAIGDFMCQVSRHPGDPATDTACLRCLFAPEEGPRAELVTAAATGLRPWRISQNDIVRDEDILEAPPHQRESLRAKMGEPIRAVACSVARDALVSAISDLKQHEGFEPSVPFVATCSAAMVVGEWIKVAMGLPSQIDPRFQFDALHGPAAGVDFPESRHVDCECVKRRVAIEQYRAARRVAGA